MREGVPAFFSLLGRFGNSAGIEADLVNTRLIAQEMLGHARLLTKAGIDPSSLGSVNADVD